MHHRRIYNFFDFLGSIGGVVETIVMILGILMFPISEHCFVLDVIKQLFLARTFDKKLLNNETQDPNKSSSKSDKKFKMRKSITIS